MDLAQILNIDSGSAPAYTPPAPAKTAQPKTDWSSYATKMKALVDTAKNSQAAPVKSVVAKPDPYLDRARKLIEDAKNGFGAYGPTSISALPSKTTTPTVQFGTNFKNKLGQAFGSQGIDQAAETTGNALGAAGSFAWDAIGRPVVQSVGNHIYEPLADLANFGRGEQSKVLIPDNPITGQIGGRTFTQNLGTDALALSNFIGGGVVDDVAKVGYTGIKKYLTSDITKKLGEGALIGGLGTGGYEAEQKDATAGSIAANAGIGALFGIGLASIPLAAGAAKNKLTDAIATQGIKGLDKAALAEFEKVGLKDEAQKVVADALAMVKTPEAKKAGLTVEQALDETVKASPKAAELDVAMKAIADKNQTLLSGKNTKLQIQINKLVDHRIPNTPVLLTERAAIIERFKNQAFGARAGYTAGKQELGALVKTAETFIKKAIPDLGLTKGEATRLLSALGNITNEKGLDEVITRAVKIAEDSAKRDLKSTLTASVKDVLGKQVKVTPGMLNNAGSLKSSLINVAQQERNQLGLLGNFLKIGEKDVPVVKFKSAADLVESAPVFGRLSNDMLEAIAGVSDKSIADFGAEELGKLNTVVESLIEKGKADTQTSLIARGQTTVGLVDNMLPQLTNVGELAKDGENLKKLINNPNLSFANTQSWFDLMGGSIGSRSRWRQVGKAYEFMKRPVDIATKLMEKEAAAFRVEYDALMAEVRPALTTDSSRRIAIHAYSQQPSAEAALLKQVTQAEIDSTILTESETKIYNWMRQKLDEIHPELSGIMLSSQGRDIGWIDSFFPLNRDFDSLDGLAMMMEDSLTGRNFKPDFSKLKTSAGFGNITKSRSGLEDQFANAQLDAFASFSKYMNKGIYYKHLELPIENIKNIMANADFQKAVGGKAIGFLDGYVKRLSRGGTKLKASEFDWLFSAIKKNQAVYYLGKISSATKQFTSAILATGYMSPKYLVLGVKDAMNADLRQFALEHSNDLLLRAGGEVDTFQLNQTLKNIGGAKTVKGVLGAAYDKTQKIIMSPMRIADAHTATAVWLGAYRNGVELFGNDITRASHYADDIMNRTQASAHFKDIAAVQNHSSGVSAALPFQTFSIGMWNVIRDDIIRTGFFSIKEREYMQAAGSFWVALAFGAAMSAETAVDYAFSDPGTGLNADDYLARWERDIIPQSLSFAPVAGQVFSAAQYNNSSVFAPLGVDKMVSAASNALDFAGDTRDFARGKLSSYNYGKSLKENGLGALDSIQSIVFGYPTKGIQQAIGLGEANYKSLKNYFQ